MTASATLGSTQESARFHLIGGMVRPGDVLSLRAYVQLPQHVSDELLHVLMATVTEGDARALSVGQWCGGHDPIRVDDDGLIVRLRELHECHERSTWLLGARAARGARNLRRAGVKVKPVYRKHKGALQMACGVCARSTRRAASLPGEGSTHLRGCGMTAVGTFRIWRSSFVMSVIG